MALEITSNTPIVLDNGIAVSSLYCRTTAELGSRGDEILAAPTFWASKEAYSNFQMQVTPLFAKSLKIFAPYDRTTQGTDILRLSNEWMQIQVDSQGLSSTIIDL